MLQIYDRPPVATGMEIKLGKDNVVEWCLKENHLVVSEKFYTSYISEDEEDEEKCFDFVYLTPKQLNVTSCHCVRLSNATMNDDTFSEWTTQMQTQPPIKIDKELDLSFNHLTPACIPLLLYWMEQIRVPFINLYGNSWCCMTKIGGFCKKAKQYFQGDLEKVCDFMRHIIFLPKYYIGAATKVRYYQQMEKKGYLPSDWTSIHMEFYGIKEEDRNYLRYDPDWTREFEDD